MANEGVVEDQPLVICWLFATRKPMFFASFLVIRPIRNLMFLAAVSITVSLEEGIVDPRVRTQNHSTCRLSCKA